LSFEEVVVVEAGGFNLHVIATVGLVFCLFIMKANAFGRDAEAGAGIAVSETAVVMAGVGLAALETAVVENEVTLAATADEETAGSPQTVAATPSVEETDAAGASLVEDSGCVPKCRRRKLTSGARLASSNIIDFMMFDTRVVKSLGLQGFTKRQGAARPFS
jgi:hypothetical protein